MAGILNMGGSVVAWCCLVSRVSGAAAHPGRSNWQCEETRASAKPPRRLHAGAGAPIGQRASVYELCVLGSAGPGMFFGWWALSVGT